MANELVLVHSSNDRSLTTRNKSFIKRKAIRTEFVQQTVLTLIEKRDAITMMTHFEIPIGTSEQEIKS